MDAFGSTIQRERNAVNDHVVVVPSDFVWDWLNTAEDRWSFGKDEHTRKRWVRWMMDCRPFERGSSATKSRFLDILQARVIAVPVCVGLSWAACIIEPTREVEGRIVHVHLNSHVYDCLNQGNESVVTADLLRRIKRGIMHMSRHLGHTDVAWTRDMGTNCFQTPHDGPPVKLAGEHRGVCGQVVAAYVWAACVKVDLRHLTVSNAMRLHISFVSMILDHSSYAYKRQAKRRLETTDSDTRPGKRQRTDEHDDLVS